MQRQRSTSRSTTRTASGPRCTRTYEHRDARAAADHSSVFQPSTATSCARWLKCCLHCKDAKLPEPEQRQSDEFKQLAADCDEPCLASVCLTHAIPTLGRPCSLRGQTGGARRVRDAAGCRGRPGRVPAAHRLRPPHHPRQPAVDGGVGSPAHGKRVPCVLRRHHRARQGRAEPARETPAPPPPPCSCNTSAGGVRVGACPKNE